MIKQMYTKDALIHSAVFKWHKNFAQGRGSWEDDEPTRLPRTVRTELKIQEVAMLLCANHSKVIDEVTDATRIIHDTCHKNVRDDLDML
jgi:hypothetical protein